MTGLRLLKMQKLDNLAKISLTITGIIWYDKFVGVVGKPPFLFEVML